MGPFNIWIERSYRQDIFLHVMGYIGDKLLFEYGYYHKHTGCVSHLGEEHTAKNYSPRILKSSAGSVSVLDLMQAQTYA